MVKTVNVETPIKNGLKVVLKKFREHTKNPEIFITAQIARSEKIKALVKSLYDYGQSTDLEATTHKSYLDELIVDEMDEEQIWQQLELKNEQMLGEDLPKTSKLLSMGSKRMLLAFQTEEEEVVDHDEEVEAGSDVDLEMASANGLSADEDETSQRKKKKSVKTKGKKKAKRSIVDDKFFKLEDMARFLDEEDERENRRHAGKPERNSLIEIDYFSENVGEDNDDDDAGMTYADFFDDDDNENEEDSDPDEDEVSDEESASDQADKMEDDEEQDENVSGTEDNQKKQTYSEDSEDEVERNRRLRYELYNSSNDFMPGNENKKPTFTKSKLDDDNDNESLEESSQKQPEKEEERPQEDYGPKSSFELRQEKLKTRIQKMENQLLTDKPWQLKGEISADTRPQNSLLEEVLEFESTTRPAPVITEETTMRLEDIIRQRIKNKAYDDVERKIRPPDNPREYRKQLVLDSEKSKESLAQIYEKDYLKQLEKTNPDADQAEEEEPKEHKTIRAMMKTILAQLDALSNFHYTPRPAVPELKIITNTPAISMEEVAPVATSDGTLLAPEEVRNRPKGVVMSKEERSKTDKNRERRLKKRFQRDKFDQQAAKERKMLEKGVTPKSKDLQEKLLKKVTKAKNVSAMTETKGMAKSSTAFFSRLQDEVSTQIKSKLDPSHKKGKKNGISGLQATHVKL